MRALDDSWRATAGWLAALIMLTACGARDTAPPATGTAVASSVAETTTTTVAAQGPQIKKWIDLQVGDCLTDPPPVDPGVVMVSVVDCAIPHAAEVYLRTDVEVNAAVAEVADRDCKAG